MFNGTKIPIITEIKTYEQKNIGVNFYPKQKYNSW